MKPGQTKLTPLLGAALLLAACSKQEAPHAPAKPDPAPVPALAQAKAAGSGSLPSMMDLMRVVYGRTEGDHVIATFRNEEAPLVRERFRLEPVSMRALGADRVALVANGVLDEIRDPKYENAGRLSAYLLQKQDGEWTVERKFENASSSGTFGQLGNVSWLDLGAGKPGFGIESTYTPDGLEIRQISLFDLAAPRMRNMSIFMRSLASDNEKICDAAKPECWSIKGTWRFERQPQQVYDDVVVDYVGYVETRPNNAPESEPRSRSEVNSTLRYTYRHGEYYLVSGELPSVPGL
ncbi:hypothetical protein [Pseudoduganella violaceinigra]|uniref:hypothetical protein n=1 Tax=Pseudoduganella violaceinigra TaxID=246602 RepID=UPI000402DCFA|nr:hypothetical protein [Pseudoduganella violaceinigra]